MQSPRLGIDQQIAAWFHAHLSWNIVYLLRALSAPGSKEWVAMVLFFMGVFFIWKRAWPSLATLVVSVPSGILLNDLVKVIVHRPRPFSEGPFINWSGYSFPSGHTTGATLLYGQLILFLLPALKSKSWRRVILFTAVMLILIVGFSRVALGAHYLSDVLAAIFFGVVWLVFCLMAEKSIRLRYLPAQSRVADLPIGGELAVLPVTVDHPPEKFR